MEYSMAWIVLLIAFVFVVLPAIGNFMNMDDNASYAECLGDGAVLVTVVVVLVCLCGSVLWAIDALMI